MWGVARNPPHARGDIGVAEPVPPARCGYGRGAQVGFSGFHPGKKGAATMRHSLFLLLLLTLLGALLCQGMPYADVLSIEVWGNNNYGNFDVPAPNKGFTAIEASIQHSLGLRADGSIAAWGSNVNGALNVPAPNTGFVGIATGDYSSFGLRVDGSIAAWGASGGSGILSVPAPNSGFIATSADSRYALGLRAEGSIAAWGSNNTGVLNVPVFRVRAVRATRVANI